MQIVRYINDPSEKLEYWQLYEFILEAKEPNRYVEWIYYGSNGAEAIVIYEADSEASYNKVKSEFVKVCPDCWQVTPGTMGSLG